MARKKNTFFKVKEKLVFVPPPPKKNSSLKTVGVIVAVIGIILVISSVLYWFLKTQAKPKETVKIVEVEKVPEFYPKRIIFPQLNLDLKVENSTIAGFISIKPDNFENNQEILVLSDDLYKRYLISQSEEKLGSDTGKITINQDVIDLFLPLNKNYSKFIFIKAEEIK